VVDIPTVRNPARDRAAFVSGASAAPSERSVERSVVDDDQREVGNLRARALSTLSPRSVEPAL
jgi:hypothetical protein